MVKIAIDIPFEAKKKMTRWPWGYQRLTLLTFINTVNNLVEIHGPGVVTLIAENRIDILKIIEKEAAQSDARELEKEVKQS